jgi:hypothetical protein
MASGGFIQNLRKIQERWVEQVKKAKGALESFQNKNTIGRIY